MSEQKPKIVKMFEQRKNSKKVSVGPTKGEIVDVGRPRMVADNYLRKIHATHKRKCNTGEEEECLKQTPFTSFWDFFMATPCPEEDVCVSFSTHPDWGPKLKRVPQRCPRVGRERGVAGLPEQKQPSAKKGTANPPPKMEGMRWKQQMYEGSASCPITVFGDAVGGNSVARRPAKKRRLNVESRMPKEDTSSKCVVCLASEKSHLFHPCGHHCVCAHCSVWALEQGKCPFCRQTITSSTKANAANRKVYDSMVDLTK